MPEPHGHLQPNLDHTNHHEVSEAPNNCQETIPNDLSTALLKIGALEKSVQQLKENIKGIEAENLYHKKQLQEQQYLIACLSSNPNNKKSNNETPSLEPGVQPMNKDTIITVDSEVSDSTKGNPVASGGMEEAEKGDGNEEEEPDGVDTGDNEVSGPVNSQAFTPGGIAEAERRAGNEKKEPKRIKKHPILNKVVNALFTTRSLSSLGSPPPDQLPDAAPGNGKSKNRTKDEKVSKKDTESVQIISDGLAAHPLKRCDNCRTHPCLDNQVITTNNLVLEIGPFKNGKTYQKSDFKGILGGKNVTGVVQIHQHNRYTKFMHYIEGERQTWKVDGEEKSWAPFTNDISTLLYRCKR